MNRLIIILLCICGAVVCAFLAYLGHQQDIEAKKNEVAAPAEFTCKSLLENIPADTFAFTVTNFQPGKHFIPDDNDGDGVWERVIIPVFPDEMKKLGRNYRALFLVFANIPNKDALFEKVQSNGIVAEFWLTKNKLDSDAYNRMAEKYTSMDFSRSTVLYSGYPKSEATFGKIMMWVSSGGAVLSILILGWQSMSLVIAGIKSESRRRDDDEEEVITNRAGLPTKQDEGRE